VNELTRLEPSKLCVGVEAALAVPKYPLRPLACPLAMNDSTPSRLDSLSDPVGHAWRLFIERCEPLRPELYRYCRYLTGSPWEADDLVQDALMRSFVSLGHLHQQIENPRAWLFRVASNLRLNQARGAREVPAEPAPPASPPAADPRDTREASGSLIGLLAPQERAAVVLKDVFGLSLEEIAETLETSPGAVKAALHRGRGKLADPEPKPEAVPIPAVLNEFCAAFNARDLDRVTSLLLDKAVVEAPGLSLEYGAQAARSGSLAGAMFGDPTAEHGFIAPAYREGLRAAPPRLELRVHRGEVLMLGWFSHQDGEAVRAISRATLAGERIAHLSTYLHAPDVLAEICAELGVPFRSSGYRYWW
jgi:RNA polymerase sigma-70 factor (ECF subfamily)